MPEFVLPRTSSVNHNKMYVVAKFCGGEGHNLGELQQ